MLAVDVYKRQVGMLGRCGSRITHLGMLCNDAAYGIVFKAGNPALSVGDRKLPSLIVIRIGGLIAECVRNRNRQTECIIGCLLYTSCSTGDEYAVCVRADTEEHYRRAWCYGLCG